MNTQTIESKNEFTYEQKNKVDIPKMDMIFWLLSCVSWLLLIVAGWISIKWLNDESYYVIWTIYVERNFENYYYLPFQMHVALTYIAFILSLTIILFAFILYFIKTLISKDQNIIRGMLGPYTKFHFLSLFFAASLFIIGESYSDNVNFQAYGKDMYIAGLILSLLGIICLLFIYTQMNLDGCKWWEILLLKKGTYSCLIVLMLYYFCYDIFYVHLGNNPDETYEDEWNWKKGCGLFFSIVFGVFILFLSFVFKDLIMCFMNIIIYTGLVVYYYKIPNYFRKIKYLNKNADGGVDIAILFLSLVLFCILLIKFRNECLSS